jgi:hypothetical protein
MEEVLVHRKCLLTSSFHQKTSKEAWLKLARGIIGTYSYEREASNLVMYCTLTSTNAALPIPMDSDD